VSVQELDRIPDLLPLYARAVAASVGGGDDLPRHEVLVREVTFDPGHLAAYARLCGFRLRDTLPSTYPHVVAFPLAVHLMARRAFPFALPGLVHLGQRIAQREPIGLDDTVTLRARTADLRPHPKGQRFDVVVGLEVAGEPRWHATSTYLHRGGDAPGSSAPAGTDQWTPLPGPPSATWHVAADTGRRYAAISGDRNPIHLTRLTARLGGFPRPIAHGMWTMARCLAALEGRTPDRHVIEVGFRKPVMLPSTVELRTAPTAAGWRLDLRDARRGGLHVTGHLTQESPS
jgi:acyl dehydratase